MGPVKRVLLGSAAGVFAVAGAQAADLAVKAKPVEYVRVCSLYGAGFWYVPGTDTCIKIGAFVKLQLHEHMNSGGPFLMGAAAWAAMTMTYSTMVRYYRLNPAWALALPLAALLYLGATIHSAVKYWNGSGGDWKGRVQDANDHGQFASV